MDDDKAPLGVFNLYSTPSSLKARLGLTDKSNDETLWHLLHLASRIVDSMCGRHFYVSTETKRFDVGDPDSVHVADLLDVGQVVEDWDGDGVYERVRHRSEYVLYPLDANPASLRGSPHHVMRTGRNQSGRCFPVGRAAMQITGRWGYRSHFAWIDCYVANSGSAVSPYSRSIRIDNGGELRSGNTILINNEQLFVTQAAKAVVNVLRGVNGTTASSHDDSSEVKLLRYPPEVEEATLLMAIDRWRRHEAILAEADSDADDAQNGEASTKLSGDVSSEVKRLLAPYRRLSI